jgi:hypothetical protein
MLTVVRRFALWALICCISAAPSFALAYTEYDVAGMVTGIILFTCLYTVITSTQRFERFHARPFIRRTLYIGYGTRMGISLLMIFAVLSGPYLGWLALPLASDFLLGAISVGIAGALGLLENDGGHMPSAGFLGTLVTTCIQGTLLNIVVGIFMLVVYGIQRAVAKPPPELRRGFEVLSPQNSPTTSSP